MSPCRISTSTPRSPTASCATMAWRSASGIFWGQIDRFPSLRGAKRRSNPFFFHDTHGLLRGACHRAALRADPLARNDGERAAPRWRAIAWWAAEEKGIRWNVIAPGFMDMLMGRDSAVRPLGHRLGGRYAMLFLISNESSYVNARAISMPATWRASCAASLRVTNGWRHCYGGNKAPHSLTPKFFPNIK